MPSGFALQVGCPSGGQGPDLSGQTSLSLHFLSPVILLKWLFAYLLHQFTASLQFTLGSAAVPLRWVEVEKLRLLS